MFNNEDIEQMRKYNKSWTEQELEERKKRFEELGKTVTIDLAKQANEEKEKILKYVESQRQFVPSEESKKILCDSCLKKDVCMYRENFLLYLDEVEELERNFKTGPFFLNLSCSLFVQKISYRDNVRPRRTYYGSSEGTVTKKDNKEEI